MGVVESAKPLTDSDAVRKQVCRSVLRAVLDLCGGIGDDNDQDDVRTIDDNEEERNHPNNSHGKTSRPTTTRTTTFWKEWVPQTITQTSTAVDQNLQGKPWDFEIRTGTSLYHRFKNRGEAELDLVSNLGLRRTVRSALEMGQLLSDWMQEQRHYDYDDDEEYGDDDGIIEPRSCAGGGFHKRHSSCSLSSSSSSSLLEGFYMSVSPKSGFILLVSPRRRQALYELAERWPCPNCCQWLRGSKGLWWHQQQQHGNNHATATAQATQTRQLMIGHHALVVYNSNNNDRNNPLHCLTSPSSRQHTASKDDKTRSNSAETEERAAIMTNTTLRRTSTESTIKTPFQLAAEGDLNGLKRLVEARRLNPMTNLDNNGASVLLWAAGGGQLNIVRYLVEECKCDPNQAQHQNQQRGFGGRTALHWAARKGHVHVVEYLLSKVRDGSSDGHGDGDDETQAVDLEAQTADGTTALAWAAWQAHLSVLHILYQHGANVQTVNNYGCNAALWAAQGGPTPAVDRAVRNTQASLNNGDDKQTKSSGEQRVVFTLQWLDSVGCDLYQINHNGHGILHKAAQRNRIQVARWFLNKLHEDHPSILDAANKKDVLDHDDKTNNNTSCSRVNHDVKNTNNSSGDHRRIFEISLQLIAPDEEGCTPSDLAGMEGHGELAHFLALSERQLVSKLAHWSRCYLEQEVPHESETHRTASSALWWPSWLAAASEAAPTTSTTMTVSSSPSSSQGEAKEDTRNNEEGPMSWGPGYGVQRLQLLFPNSMLRLNQETCDDVPTHL